jgi:hypothetical protein
MSMKPRHAAALALVGWYLMVPPMVSSVTAEEKVYEKLGRLIQFIPVDDFKPTVATLVAGELACPTTRAMGTALGCASELLHQSGDALAAMLAECQRASSHLGCAKTTTSRRVNVSQIYDLSIAGKLAQKRSLAQVRLESGEVLYVGVASLDF